MKKTHRLGAIALATLVVATPHTLAQNEAADASDATVEYSLAVDAVSDAVDALAAMREDGEAQAAPIADARLDDRVENGGLTAGSGTIPLP